MFVLEVERIVLLIAVICQKTEVRCKNTANHFQRFLERVICAADTEQHYWGRFDKDV